MNQVLRTFAMLMSSALLALTCSNAFAWSRAGHMVTASIAFAELSGTEKIVIERIMEMMAAHPDRAPFQLAGEGQRDDARSERIFMEMARWADDVRGGEYDHPTWHYASKSVLEAGYSPPRGADLEGGVAVQAFALQVALAADESTPLAERAIALCWVFHLIGDIHQPLHAADWRSAKYPQGDRGGGMQYVIEPQSNQPLSLHSYWDGLIATSSEPRSVTQTAGSLRTQWPRTKLPLTNQAGSPADFEAWADESLQLAKRYAYTADLSTSAQPNDAKALPNRYVDASRGIAEQRMALAGYRLADVLRRIFGKR